MSPTQAHGAADENALAFRKPTCAGNLKHRAPLAVEEFECTRKLTAPLRVTLPGTCLLTRRKTPGGLWAQITAPPADSPRPPAAKRASSP